MANFFQTLGGDISGGLGAIGNGINHLFNPTPSKPVQVNNPVAQKLTPNTTIPSLNARASSPIPSLSIPTHTPTVNISSPIASSKSLQPYKLNAVQQGVSDVANGVGGSISGMAKGVGGLISGADNAIVSDIFNATHKDQINNLDPTIRANFYNSELKNIPDPEHTVNNAVGSIMAAATATGIPELATGGAETLSQLAAKNFTPVVLKALMGAGAGGIAAPAITAGQEALGTGLQTGAPTVSGKDVLNSILPGATTGGLFGLGTKTPVKAVDNTVANDTTPQVSKTVEPAKVVSAVKEANTAVDNAPTPDNVVKQATTAKTLDNIVSNDSKPAQGDYKTVVQRADATKSVAQVLKNESVKAVNKLSGNDRGNFADYFEGTKDVKTADDPIKVQNAIDTFKKGSDTMYKIDKNWGGSTTDYRENYFPHNWDLSKNSITEVAQKAAGDAWDTMSQEDKDNAVLQVQDKFQMVGKNKGYNGYRNGERVFNTVQEGKDAGFKLTNGDVRDDIKNYFDTGASTINKGVIKNGLRTADLGNNMTEGLRLSKTDLVKVSPEAAKAFKGRGYTPVSGILQKVGNAANSIDAAALNMIPAIHMLNQEGNAEFVAAWKMPGNKIANMANVLKNQFNLSDADKEVAAASGTKYADFGKGGFITRGIKEVTGKDVSGVNLGAKAMSKLENNVRTSIYKTAVERGMSGADAADLVNYALGDSTHVGGATTMFAHYLKTNLNIIKGTGVGLVHGNLNPLVGLAIGAATVQVADNVLQGVTGNNNATVHSPGVLGTIKQLTAAPGEIASGKVPSIVTSHLSPTLLAGYDQLIGKNYYTGQSLNTPNSRVNDFLSTTLAPYQNTSKVTQGKNTPTQEASSAILGINMPHTTGTAAAPKATGAIGSLLNTPGATTDTNARYAQSKSYYGALDKQQGALSGDTEATNAFNMFIGRSKDNQGNTISLNPVTSVSAYGALYGNDKALSAVQNVEKADANHDPIWDLTGNKLSTMMQYLSAGDGSVKSAIGTANPWIKDVTTARSAFYNSLPKSANPSSQQYSQGEINNVTGKGYTGADGKPLTMNDLTYPTFDTNTQSLLDQYNKTTDATAKATLMSENPQISKAFSDLATYTNAMTAAQGGVPDKNYPVADSTLQNYLTNYTNSDKATRASIRNANPTAYQNMIAYYDAIDLYNVGKAASTNSLQGMPDTTDKELKDMSSLAKDIYQNPDGTYSIMPAGWMNGLSNGYGGSSGSSGSSEASYARAAIKKANQDMFNAMKGTVRHYGSNAPLKLNGLSGNSMKKFTATSMLKNSKKGSTIKV
jgi:hypothetical protein